jgi:hypothetical protein
MDQFLDTARTGPFWLRMASIAALVVDGIAFGQDPLTPHIPIAKLTRRLKGYTAREANRSPTTTGCAVSRSGGGS